MTSQVRDASTSLLQRIVDESLDPTYAEAASRRMPSAGRRGTLAVAFLMALLGLVTAVSVARTWQDQPGVERSRQDLVARIESATAALDVESAAVRDLEAQVRRLRAQVLADTGQDRAVAERVEQLASVTGTGAVAGPGVVVVLDDGRPQPAGGDGPDLARVLDRDVQLAVNGLLGAGAEAVSVNGERVTSTTAIRSAGDAILVNYRPLTRPYQIEAVGDPRTLASQFLDGDAGRELASLVGLYGLRFETTTADRLLLPAEPLPDLRYARPVED